VNSPNPVDEATQSEMRSMLDQELSRLPDRYRVPLVLHYLEGRTQEEVSQLLGCSRNTIHSRLARACERLRGRLTRRGLALTSGGLAAALSEEASAAVPAMLVDATVKAAMLFVAGGSALVPPAAVSFAQGVMKAMFLDKMKIALRFIFVLVTVATGAGVLARHSSLPGAPVPPQFTSQVTVVGADARDEVVRKELEKFQGTWIMSGIQLDAQAPAPQDTTSDARTEWTIRGNKYTIGQVGEKYKKQRA
jgi:hypothetical protein